MRLGYRLKFSDYVLFCATHQLLSVPLQAAYLLLAWLMYSVLDEQVGSLGAGVFALITYLASWVFQLTFNVIYLYSSKNKSLLTEHIVEVQSDAFYDETRFNKSFHYWPGVAKIVRRPGFVAVYINAMAAHIIPRRAFSGHEQRDEFVALVRQRLEASKSSGGAR